MEKIIIAAIADNGVIGRDNDLPWDLLEDRRLFRDLTLGQAVIMGRRTFESLNGKPLPQRHNIVVSRTLDPQADIHICPDFDSALTIAQTLAEKVFFIGGEQIYRRALAVADLMILSRVHGSFAGDTFFPEFDANQWRLVSEKDYPGFRQQVLRRQFVNEKFSISVQWQPSEETASHPIDQIEAARARNNLNWMSILRLALEKSPETAKPIVAEIKRIDREISDLADKLTEQNT
jgi:dihydrofolate reductase